MNETYSYFILFADYNVDNTNIVFAMSKVVLMLEAFTSSESKNYLLTVTAASFPEKQEGSVLFGKLELQVTAQSQMLCETIYKEIESVVEAVKVQTKIKDIVIKSKE